MEVLIWDGKATGEICIWDGEGEGIDMNGNRIGNVGRPASSETSDEQTSKRATTERDRVATSKAIPERITLRARRPIPIEE